LSLKESDRKRVRSARLRTLFGWGSRLFVPVLVIAGIVGVWQLVLVWRDIPDYLLPRPIQVWHAFSQSPSTFLSNVGVTTREIILGLAIGIAGALVWAVLLVSFGPVRKAVYPLMVAAQSAPKEALAPVFIIWWGFSSLPKVVMAALICFFPMLVATVVGLERFSDQQRLLAASIGAGRLRTLFSFRVWTALPSFLSGIRLGVTLAAVGAVLGEFLGSDKGVGYQILSASRRLNGGLLYASLIALIVISWGLVRIVDLAEAWLLRGVKRGRFIT
jgi:NitT/TauT family transport system permease protein